jgi:hypothetical protein
MVSEQRDVVSEEQQIRNELEYIASEARRLRENLPTGLDRLPGEEAASFVRRLRALFGELLRLEQYLREACMDAEARQRITDQEACARRREEPEFNLEGCYALDAERRIGRRYARLEHIEEALGYDLLCLEAPNGASKRKRRELEQAIARKREELEKLRPYWGPGVTKEEAIGAYEAAQQEGERNVAAT